MARRINCLSFFFLILATLCLGQKEPTKSDSYYNFLRGTQLRAEGRLEEAEETEQGIGFGGLMRSVQPMAAGAVHEGVTRYDVSEPVTVPDDGSTSRLTIFSVVVFPQPDSPSSARSSPEGRSSDSSRTA